MTPLPPLALIGLSSLVMLAFAGNSILNRLALAEGLIDPVSFAALRVASGAAILLLLLIAQGSMGNAWKRPHLASILGLSLYMVGFTQAYLSLDAGVGALVLFAVVQLSMFAWVVYDGQRIPALQWAGMALALGGLTLMLWPSGAVQLSLSAVALMILAGLGWAAFSLAGAREAAPLPATAWSFVLIAPLFLGLMALNFANMHLTWHGVGLALVAGALTSGLGYALWYLILPSLGATRAAVAQLIVPVLAILLGLVVLEETVGLKFLIAAGIVVAGTLLALLTKSRS